MRQHPRLQGMDAACQNQLLCVGPTSLFFLPLSLVLLSQSQVPNLLRTQTPTQAGSRRPLQGASWWLARG